MLLQNKHMTSMSGKPSNANILNSDILHFWYANFNYALHLVKFPACRQQLLVPYCRPILL
jgi:hypothetical protein